jgi:YidC/Oxa1 family membrane protein insertase
MQNRNIVLFMVLCMLILSGWFWMQNKIWPPKPPTPDQAGKKVDWLKYGPVAKAANLIANRALPIDFPARLGQDLMFTPPRSRRSLRWDDLSDEQQRVVTMLPLPLANPFGRVARLLPPVTSEVEEIAFGDERYHLQGSFTTRAAGVRKLVLNKFEAANWLGEPTQGKLELIQDDPEMPSYRMYHYPAAKDKEADFAAAPLDTLGRRIWRFEGKKEITKDNAQIPTLEFRFSTDDPGDGYKHLRIIKTYRLAPGEYHLSLTLEFQDRRDSNTVKDDPMPAFRYQLVGAHGLPIEGVWYTSTYRDALIGMVGKDGSLYRTKEEAVRISIKQGGEAVPSPTGGPGDELVQYAAVVNQYFAAVILPDDEQPPAVMKKIIRWARPTLESVETQGTLTNVTATHAMIADAGSLRPYLLLPRVKKHIDDAGLKIDTPVVISYYELADGRRVATWIRRGREPRSYYDDITVRVNSEPFNVAPERKFAHRFLLYHGPVKTSLLGQFGGDKAVAPELVERYTHTLHLNTLTDYRSAGPFGAFSQAIHFTDLLITVTKLMHTLLYWLHFLVGSYGLTIILLTVIVRGLMFPISRKQAYFSARMQEAAPELKKIKEKYAKDHKALMEATQEVYRKYHINPLGSCLPLLMQMPIFLGLYYALQESIHFRLAEFLWIKNLAAPDMLLWWTEKIPLISDPDNHGNGFLGVFYLGPFLNLLPLFAVALMIVQQKIMTPPPQDEQQEMQQKMMKYMMVFFGVLFYKVASGLCIYFIASSLWGLAERRLLPKKKPALQLAGQAPSPGKPGLPPPRGKSPKGKGPGKTGAGKKLEKTNGTVQKVKDWWAEVLKQAKKK